MIYWLCNDCAEKMDSNEILERIASNLTGKYRHVYYSIVYGDPDCTEGWGPKTLH